MGEAEPREEETLADGPPPAAPGATIAGDAAPGAEAMLAGGPIRSGDATLADGTAPARAPRGLPAVPGYAIEAEIGRGGMGVVYRARQLRLGRTVALKMILAGDHAGAYASARFLAEAAAIARLEHANIVRIHHIDEHEGRPYFEMEYVAGGSLADRLDGAPRPPLASARLVGRLARAVAEAHRSGIVHRDLKPANILLTPDGTPKVADFGLAKSLGADSSLTATDSILGSPSYMAPEQAEGKGHEAGAAADVYSLGAILYEQLTGRPPFVGATVLDTLQLVKATEPVAPTRLVHGLPRDVETICLKCLEKSPSRRYASASALADELDRLAEGAPIVARPVPFWERGWKWARRRPAIAALALALGLATAAMLAMGAVSYVRINQALGEANDERARALVARNEEAVARVRADEARVRADDARNAALAETYRASLSEARALRAGHPLGWRGGALGILSRLATMPTSRRDLAELRTEAVASLGEPDVVEVARLEGYRRSVWSLEFSPDYRALATASLDGALDLWDVGSRQHRWRVVDAAGRGTSNFQQKGEPIVRARFLPDGGLVRTTWGHRVEFLDASGRPTARPPIDGGAARPVGLDLDRRGRSLAVGWDDGSIRLYDAAGAPRRSIKGDPEVFALSPDGRRLALVGPDFAVQVCPVEGDGPPVTLGRHREAISSLAFSPDGATVASASWDKSAAIWDVARRERRVIFRGHKERVTALAFSPDGDWVATAGQDYTSRIWEARTGQTVAVLPGRWFAQAVAFSPDGQHLAVSSLDGARTVRVYQIRGLRERRSLVGHRNGVQSLAFHPRTARLASGADDHDIIVWDAEAARPAQRWTAHERYVGALAYSPDGSLLASGRGDSPRVDVRIWDAETGALRRALSGPGGAVHALAFDPSGRRLATGDIDGVLILWDAATGQVLRREAVGTPPDVRSIAFIDGGRRLAAAAINGPVVVYDLEGTDPPRRASVPGGMRWFVVDRTRDALIVAGKDGLLTRVSLRDLAPGRRLDKGHDGEIESIALDPSGRLLATGGETDHRVILRDATTFEPLLTLPPWTGKAKALAFDASGRWLAVAGADSDVGLWDMGLVRDELAAAGLAWDRPAPEVSPADEPIAPGRLAGAGVPVIRARNPDPPAEAPRPEPEASSYVGLGLVTTADPAGARVVRLTPGGPADADGRLRPGDVILGVEPSSPFAGRPLDEVSAALKGAAGTAIRLVVRPSGTEGRAVYKLTRAPIRPPAWFGQLLALDEAVANAPDDPAPRVARGELLGRHGDWAGALADFVRARDLDPANHGPWYRAAPLYLAVGDLPGYRRHCRAMLDRFGATDDPTLAERTAKACLLAPGAPVDPGLVTALAGRSVARGAGHHYLDYFRFVRAMAQSRCVGPSRTVPQLEEIRALGGDRYLTSLSGLFLAMAHQRLGHADLARDARQQALAGLAPEAGPSSPPDYGGAWADWLMCRIVGREAEAVILLDPIFPADPFAR